MTFRVYELMTDKDVTDEREWFINSEGHLMFMTDDVNCPRYEVNSGKYYYKLELAIV